MGHWHLLNLWHPWILMDLRHRLLLSFEAQADGVDWRSWWQDPGRVRLDQFMAQKPEENMGLEEGYAQLAQILGLRK